MPAVNSQASRRLEWGSGSLKLWLTPRKKSRTVLTDKQWRAVYERKKSEQEPFVCVCMWVKDVCVCVCVSARQVCWLTLIGRRAQQECARLQRSAGQVQTALSSHERVIVTGKSLHDQREPGPGQICTTLKIIPVFFWRGLQTVREWWTERRIMIGEEESLILTRLGMCYEEVTPEGRLFCRWRIIKGPVCRNWLHLAVRASVWFARLL